MKATPATRARRAAERELAALVAHTPCLGGLVSPGRGLFKFDVDLPFLAWDSKARAPRECRGFRLAVALPTGYPTAPPRVAFVSEETIFHPAVSPRFFADNLNHAFQAGISISGSIDHYYCTFFGNPVYRSNIEHGGYSGTYFRHTTGSVDITQGVQYHNTMRILSGFLGYLIDLI